MHRAMRTPFVNRQSALNVEEFSDEEIDSVQVENIQNLEQDLEEISEEEAGSSEEEEEHKQVFTPQSQGLKATF